MVLLSTCASAAHAALCPYHPAAVVQARRVEQRPLASYSCALAAPQVARIETEKLILELLDAELAARKTAGTYSGKFAGLTHYFGYEGRCSLPSNFDAACAHARPAASHTLELSLVTQKPKMP